jgi:hypothetical protein
MGGVQPSVDSEFSIFRATPRYNKMPLITANNPFKAPRSVDNTPDSCNQERTANIIPNPDNKSQISLNRFINTPKGKCE